MFISCVCVLQCDGISVNFEASLTIESEVVSTELNQAPGLRLGCSTGTILAMEAGNLTEWVILSSLSLIYFVQKDNDSLRSVRI